MFNLAQELLLRKLAFEAPESAMACLDLVLIPYAPQAGTDGLSEIDFQAACDSLAGTFASLEPPKPVPVDPNWMRKPDPKDEVTDFPRI